MVDLVKLRVTSSPAGYPAGPAETNLAGHFQQDKQDAQQDTCQDLFFFWVSNLTYFMKLTASDNRNAF